MFLLRNQYKLLCSQLKRRRRAGCACGCCGGWAGRHARATPAGAGAEAAAASAATPDGETADELSGERDAYRRTRAYYSAMHRLAHGAKVHRNIDLFKYFQRLYDREPDSDKLVVGEWPRPVGARRGRARTLLHPPGAHAGLDELCELSAQRPCALGCHEANQCRAFKAVAAYGEFKVVTMVGDPRLHESVWDHVARRHLHPYVAIKVNKIGRLQTRQLFLVFEEPGEDALPTTAAATAAAPASAPMLPGASTPHAPPAPVSPGIPTAAGECAAVGKRTHGSDPTPARLRRSDAR